MNLANLFWLFLGFLILNAIIFGVDVVFRFLHYKEREKLLNRLMAKDYREYQYYEREHERDLEEKGLINQEARQEREDFRREQTLEEEIRQVQEKGTDIKLEDFEDANEYEE